MALLTKAVIAPAALLFGGISFYILSRKQYASASKKGTLGCPFSLPPFGISD
ncbi:hypothetical protein ACSZNH_22690 [Aeromonas dhakensis]|uniref:hypothetical protein n=1 Tax=Aeromonas dhakensis TaxID=196024 RepID=UPI00227D118C|nr:hypothetical protein [Aeromonas dhakensis]WAF72053.1 hypothetical protein NRK99_19080 [Aeromonas dhakensis]